MGFVEGDEMSLQDKNIISVCVLSLGNVAQGVGLVFCEPHTAAIITIVALISSVIVAAMT